MAAATTLFMAGPAHAASSTTCTGTSNVTYSPGLTLTPQTIAVSETDTLTSCTSTDTTLTAGYMGPYAFSVPNAGCNYLPGVGNDGVRIHWNNGQTSDVPLTIVLTATGGIVQETGTGTVAAGEFTGATVVITWIYPVVNPLQCLLPGGVTAHNGTIVAQITGL